MKFRLRPPAFIAGLAAVVLATGAAAAPPVAAKIDQGVKISFPTGVRDVVVGNPSIADVTLLSAHSAVLMGRSYGVTSVMAFDEAGRTVFSREVVVGAGDAGRVALVRGGEMNNFACSPRCERTPMPGEVQASYTAYSTPFDDYAKRARPAASE